MYVYVYPTPTNNQPFDRNTECVAGVCGALCAAVRIVQCGMRMGRSMGSGMGWWEAKELG